MGARLLLCRTLLVLSVGAPAEAVGLLRAALAAISEGAMWEGLSPSHEALLRAQRLTLLSHVQMMRQQRPAAPNAAEQAPQLGLLLRGGGADAILHAHVLLSVVGHALDASADAPPSRRSGVNSEARLRSAHASTLAALEKCAAAAPLGAAIHSLHAAAATRLGGDAPAAREKAEEAVGTATAMGLPYVRALALAERGRCEAGRPAEQAASYRAAHELFSSLGAAHDVFLMEGLMGLNTAGWAFDLPDEDEDEGEDDDESNSMCSSTSEEDDEA